MGIEPTRPAWKAGILPLNYTRIMRTLVNRSNIISQRREFVNSIFKIFLIFVKSIAFDGMNVLQYSDIK